MSIIFHNYNIKVSLQTIDWKIQNINLPKKKTTPRPFLPQQIKPIGWLLKWDKTLNSTIKEAINAILEDDGGDDSISPSITIDPGIAWITTSGYFPIKTIGRIDFYDPQVAEISRADLDENADWIRKTFNPTELWLIINENREQ